MAISRAQLLAELLPALNEMFGMEYEKYSRNLIGGNNAIHGLACLKIHGEPSEVDAENEGKLTYRSLGRYNI
jgi:hypothetical protein